MKATLSRFLLAFMLLSLVQGGFRGGVTHAQGNSIQVRVMTYNVDEASDFGPIVTASTPAELLAAVAEIYSEVQASNIPERAEGFARKVEETLPDLIALQELSTWRTGPLLQPPATNIQFDALQSILQALAARGLSYVPVAVSTNFDAELPSAAGLDVRLTDYDAVLVRTAPFVPTRTTRAAALRVTDIQVHSFMTNISFTSPVLGPVTIPRGWISIDATTGGKPFRFVTTHLESFNSAVRLVQAQELLAVPLNTPIAVILAADLNSDAESNDPDQNGAYRAILAASMVDAWSSAHPGDPGLTWPLHGEDPFTAMSSPTQRIDIVLVRQPRVVSADLVGANPSTDLTPSGLWIADHAGVVATFELDRARGFLR